MIVAIYARKSTEQNGVADEQKSVTRQVEHATAYAERKGWCVADEHIYVDDGISGAEFANRPGFLRLMNALKPRAPFQVLIMSEESRLGRESIETAYALKQLVTAGVRVFFYLEDRERTLDSPTDKIMLSLTAFADELEREKARQRSHDAMIRKARAGHVTGGRVFGYDNVRTDLGVVVREINLAEAAIVRRIFDLCAKGYGKIAIAKRLNDEHAPAPRAQQDRPTGWAASSVREVLYRELYRGVIVWNRTRKRDRWGQKHQQARPESEWLRLDVPSLRIVDEAQWAAAHGRLAATRETYLRTTGGRLWGRPPTGLAAKYLLTGMARCGHCGGSLEVRSRNHGRQRAFFYACSSFYRRGRAVCPNGLEIPMATADTGVLRAIEQEILDPETVELTIEAVLAQAMLSESEQAQAHAQLETESRAIDAEIRRLTAAVAQGAEFGSIRDALRERETRQRQIQQAVEGLKTRGQLAYLDRKRLTQATEQRIREWRDVLRRHVPQARQILSKLLRDRLVFTPEWQSGQQGYRFRGEGTLSKLLTGLIPGFSQAVASPTGFEPVFWP